MTFWWEPVYELVVGIQRLHETKIQLLPSVSQYVSVYHYSKYNVATIDFQYRGDGTQAFLERELSN